MHAVPARPGRVFLTQPDGSRFEAGIVGDEMGHVTRTADGCAVVSGEDGWYYYATFGPGGARKSSGVRVGDPAPPGLKERSRDIPYNTIREMAARSRASKVLPRAKVSERPGYKAYVPVPPQEIKVIVLLAQFQDEKFTFTREHFVDLFNKEGYSFGLASGSVLDYFNAQFRGKTKFTFDVGPVVTLPKPVAAYGADDDQGNDVDAAGAVCEACRLSDDQVDFSQYAAIYVVYAGGNPADGSAPDDRIWPHSWDIRSGGYSLRLDGCTIGEYAMSSELMLSSFGQKTLCSIGTFCHEFSHVLGLVDSYDTDAEDSGGLDQGHRRSSLMAYGCYNNDGNTPPMYNATELDLLDIVKAESIAAGDYILPPLTGEQRRFLRIDGGDPCEYYLIEARSAVSWDKYIGGSGLLVYHIDMSSRASGYSTSYDMVLTALQRWMLNEVNARPDYLCSDLVEAYRDAEDDSQIFFPYSVHNALSADSDPALSFRDGSEAVFALSGIRRVSGGVGFRVTGPVSVLSQDVFQDAAVFNWSVASELGCSACSVRLMQGDEELASASLQPFMADTFAYVAEGLQPHSPYVLEITCALSDGPRITRLPFTTAAIAGKTFICTGSDGRLPLRVYNAEGVEYVNWTFNGRSVRPGTDGYFHLPSSGVLRALVHYASGEEEILVKHLSR